MISILPDHKQCITLHSKSTEVSKVILTCKERLSNFCRTIFTLGYHRSQQSKLFRAALYDGDFKAAEQAVRMGARNFLPASEIIDLLKQDKVSTVNFLFSQANFDRPLNSGKNEILKAVKQINISNYTAPHFQCLLKLFLTHRPLVRFVSNYWEGYGSDYPNEPRRQTWMHTPLDFGFFKKVNHEEFLKCRLLENIWMQNPKNTQVFFETCLDPHAILASSTFNPLLFRSNEFVAAIDFGLQVGLDPNNNGTHSETLLGRALFGGHEETALKLLAAGADPNARSYIEWDDYYTGRQHLEGTPLELAVKKCGSAALIEKLLAHGAKLTKSAFISSFYNYRDSTNMIRVLMESPLLLPEWLDQDLLRLAINRQQLWCVDILIKKGITPTDEMMRQVAQQGYLHIAKLLITNFPALADEKFLKLVVIQKNYELVNWLVEKNPSLKNTEVCKKLLVETQNAIAQEKAKFDRYAAEKSLLIAALEA